MPTQELDFTIALEFCLWITAIHFVSGSQNLTEDEKQAYWETVSAV